MANFEDDDDFWENEKENDNEKSFSLQTNKSDISISQKEDESNLSFDATTMPIFTSESSCSTVESEKRKRPLSPESRSSSPLMPILSAECPYSPSSKRFKFVERNDFLFQDVSGSIDNNNDNQDNKKKEIPINKKKLISPLFGLAEHVSSILTPKEKKVDMFLKEIMNTISENEIIDDTAVVAADLTHQRRLDLVRKVMNDYSLVLSHKFEPILKLSLENDEAAAMNRRYADIVEIPLDDFEMADKYWICYNAFINDLHSVNLRCGNKMLLKNIEIRNAFALVFFAMLTVRRQMCDNVISLAVVGKSSTGKSTLFENPIQSVAHNLTMDAGVGRFNTTGKTTILLHDINLVRIVKGTEAEKIKSLARCEVFQVKTHGQTQSIAPMFLILTSNQKMMAHRFAKPDPFSETPLKTCYLSDLQPTKSVHVADIEAICARYIEVFVRRKPEIPLEALPTCGVFTRQHAIVGLFQHVLSILKKYSKSDFHSAYFYLYSIGGLCKNLKLMREEQQSLLLPQIISLFEQYQLTEIQRKKCFNYLDGGDDE